MQYLLSIFLLLVLFLIFGIIFAVILQYFDPIIRRFLPPGAGAGSGIISTDSDSTFYPSSFPSDLFVDGSGDDMSSRDGCGDDWGSGCDG